MAKLYLNYEGKMLKEVAAAQTGVITIGRLPDNHIQVDNLAVSGHHAKIYFEGDHYWIEDNNSLNGTYLNNQRVTKSQLKDGDEILVGKHKIEFKDEWHEDHEANAAAAAKPAGPVVPSMQSTMVLDTKKAKEMMAQALALKAQQAGGGAAAPSAASAGASSAPPPPTAPPKERTGQLTVLEGKTDQPSYVLSGKMIVIGKSEMASIKLKGSFFKSPPDVAAMVSKRDGKYYVAQQDKNAKLKLNGVDSAAGQHELNEGDMLEVAGVKMTFGWHD